MLQMKFSISETNGAFSLEILDFVAWRLEIKLDLHYCIVGDLEEDKQAYLTTMIVGTFALLYYLVLKISFARLQSFLSL